MVYFASPREKPYTKEHTMKFQRLLRAVTVGAAVFFPAANFTSAQTDTARVANRFANVDGVRIFYRESGPKDAATIVLLHGFPSSSHMFRDLIPRLSDRYHVVAPD